MPRIQRAHLVFSGRCNMSCTFCYVQFKGHRVDHDLCFRLAVRCRQLGIPVVTINGGDPYNFPWIDELIRFAHQGCGLTVHLDTNGINLTLSRHETLAQCVEWIGLPLDGLEECHDRQRSYPGHFDQMLQRLWELRELPTQVKVNTCVTFLNVEDLVGLGRLLGRFRIDRWSLYQFWPLDSAAAFAEQYRLDDETFQSVAGRLVAEFPGLHVEVNAVQDRRGTYFLFNDRGELLMPAPGQLDRYVVAGSVFDDAAIERWCAAAVGSDRAQAQARYLSK